MASNAEDGLEQRVIRAAESALAENKVVSAIDVLDQLGWLAPSAVDRWRQGRVPYLEQVVQVNFAKLSRAMKYERAGYADS